MDESRWSKKLNMSRVIGILLLGTCLFQFYPFLMPICLAAVFAFALAPKLKWVRGQRTKKVSTVVFLLTSVVVGIVPIIFAIYRLSQKIMQFAKIGFEKSEIYAVLERLRSYLAEHASEIIPDSLLSFQFDPETLAKWSDKTVSILAGVVSSLPEFFVAAFVFFAATYFFVINGESIQSKVISLGWIEEKKLNTIVERVQKICFGTLLSTLIVSTFQATLVALGARVFGYQEVVLLFLVTYMASLIPIIGAGPVGFLLAANGFIEGKIGVGIGMLVVSCLASLTDNLIKPLVISKFSPKEAHIHPLISIIAFIGAVLTFGLPGILIGPILTQLTVALLPLLF